MTKQDQDRDDRGADIHRAQARRQPLDDRQQDVATIDPSETKRVRADRDANAAAAIAVGTGDSTLNTPLAVATPLPPRKPSHTG